MKPVKVGLLGTGTVGGGTARVLRNNAEEIARRAGRGIVIDFAATLDMEQAKAAGLGEVRLTRMLLKSLMIPRSKSSSS